MKIINFFDGYTSSSTPTQIGIQNLVEYADDNSFVADNSGTPIAGNLYYNTTLNKVRYYTNEWLSISDENDISSVMSTISALDVRVTNNESNIATNETTMNDFIATKNVANGIAPLDSSGKVPAINLPSYVDDVEEYADLANFPVTGESGKLYVALDNLKQYRWSGTMYSEVSPSDVNSVNGYTGIVTLDKSDISLTNVTDDAQLKRESGDMNTFIEKEIPANDDIVLIEDSEDSFSKKTVKLSNLLGSGQGGINHLDKNGDADNGIGDWLNGIVGSTIVTSETSPLRGSSSFIITDTNVGTINDFNIMASCAFTIDRTDINSTQWITFDFEELNSTFDSTQDCVVVIRENISNNEIIVSNETIDGRNGQYIMRFQATDVTEYKIEFIRNVNTTNTLTMEFKIDNIQIGPREITRSIGKTSWSCQFGISLDQNEFLNEGNIIQSITNPSVGVYRVYYNDSLFPNEPLVSGDIVNESAPSPTSYVFRPLSEDLTGKYVEIGIVSGTSLANLSGSDRFQIVLTQKEEDQTAYQISTDLGNREIYFESGAPDSSSIYAANTPLLWTNFIDTVGMYNQSTGAFEVKATGVYNFQGVMRTTGQVGRTFYLRIVRNGTIIEKVMGSASNQTVFDLDAQIKLFIGDTFDIRVEQTWGVYTVDADRWSNLSIVKKTNTIPLLAPTTPEIAIFKDVKPSGIDGGTATSGVSHQRDINFSNGSSFATLGTNEIIISKGKYYFDVESSSFAILSNRLRIEDDQSNVLLLGKVSRSNNSGNGGSDNPSLKGFIEFLETTTIRLIHYTFGITRAGNGLGESINDGFDEIYTTISIQKIY